MHPRHIMSSCQKTCSKYNLINVLRVSQLLSRSCTAGFSSSQRLSSSTLFALTDCGQCNRSGSARARIDVLCGSEHSSAYIELEFVQLVIICYMSISISVSLSISPATAELELRAACRGTSDSEEGINGGGPSLRKIGAATDDLQSFHTA